MPRIRNSYKEIVEALTYVKDMKGLVFVLNEALNKNLIESVSSDMLNVIDSVTLDGNVEELLDLLCWGVALTRDTSNTTMEMLIRICNRISSEVDTFVMDPSARTLSVTFICTDHRKEFLQKLSSEQKLSIAIEMSSFVKNVDGLSSDDNPIILAVFDRLVEGKSYDAIFSELPGIGENLIPLVIGLCNAYNGTDASGLITDMICEDVRIAMEEEKRKISDQIVRDSTGNVSSYEANSFVTSVLLDMIAFANKLADNSSIPIPGAEVGELIWKLYHDIRGFYQVLGDDGSKVPSTIISDALGSCYNNLLGYYRMNQSIADTLHDILSAYRKDSSDAPWFTGNYLKSVKLYLDRDPSFKMFSDEIDPEAATRLVLTTDEDAYRMMIYRYMDPSMADHLITTEASSRRSNLDEREAELDARERELERRERRLSGKDDYDDEPDEEEQNPDDRPEIDARQSNKGYHKSSKLVSDGTRKIYGAFHKYKMNESRVDSQLDKMINAMKTAFKGGDKTEAILSGKRWTPIGILKQALKTAAVFSFSKIGGIIYLVTTVALDKKRTEKQKRQILGELDTEIQLIDEKIDDAKGDGNRQAKYALMRTKGELERARDKIRYNLSASNEDLQTAKDLIVGKRYGGRR